MTVRLSTAERAAVAAYLRQNPLFDSFSALARVATLSLINQAGTIQLNPVSFTTTAKRPHFLWDYDLTETHVREILHTPGLSAQKRWLLGRLLTAARFEEIPAFVPITEIARHFHALRLSAKVRTRWAYALHHWGYDA